MKNNCPILVTGSHRSGTTWVGEVLSTSSATTYIHEPFNGMCRPGIFSFEFPNVFTYITEENEIEFYSDIASMLSFQYDAKAELAACKTPRDVARLARDYAVFYQSKRLSKSPLVKDPMAILSAEWLAKKFTAKVLMLIRHPASFVSSCHQLKWPFYFENFLNQPLLMRDYLHPFESEMVRCIEDKQSEQYSIDRLSLLWKVLYYVVARFREKHSDWLFVRYEDICNNPMDQYTHIFSDLNVAFSSASQSFIRESTTYANSKHYLEEIHSVKRDSKKHVDVWKRRLAPEDIQRIRQIVEPVAAEFYTDEDW